MVPRVIRTDATKCIDPLFCKSLKVLIPPTRNEFEASAALGADLLEQVGRKTNGALVEADKKKKMKN